MSTRGLTIIVPYFTRWTTIQVLRTAAWKMLIPTLQSIQLLRRQLNKSREQLSQHAASRTHEVHHSAGLCMCFYEFGQWRIQDFGSGGQV